MPQHLQYHTEVMSPVGSYESLNAAIQGGADAVYFGVGKLNMRSRSSQNFTIDDLKTITDLCRDHNVKTFLTLNTVVYDEETEEVKAIIDAAKAHGISAVIASDRTVFEYAIAKDLPIHASTQCNISNYEAVKYYASFCDVVVLARELNIDQVRNICNRIQTEGLKGKSGQLLRVEAFVHGALCMSVSGKCYLSLDTMNYSANRGACLQLCRRKYSVKDMEEGLELSVDGAYIMSPKDLCTIEFIDKLINAGISILKIEGRGRSPEYVKTVTRCYKEAAQSISANTFTQEKVVQWKNDLEKVYNRGFWEGYYLGKKTGEWTKKYGSQALTKKVYVGKVTNFFAKLGVAEIKIETGNLCVGDTFSVNGPTTGVVEGTVSDIRVDLNPVEKTQKGDICSLYTGTLLRRGDKLYKIINADI